MIGNKEHKAPPGRIASEVVHRSPGSLRPNPWNAHQHSKRQIKQIANCMEAVGNLPPILVDENLMILAGHGRRSAAVLRKAESVPTLMVTGLSEAQKRAFIIADNKLTENAGWNREVLHSEFEALLELLPPLGLDLTITGFSLGEIDEIQSDQGPSTQDPEDCVPIITGPVVTRRGDVWILGQHRIGCGDARSKLDLDQLINGEAVRMAFTDPPYNVRIQGHVQGRGRIKHREFAFASGEMTERQFVAFLKSAFSNMARFCIDGAICYVCIDWRHIGELLKAAAPIFTDYKNLVVWNKTSPGQGSFYRSQHELIGVFKVGTAEHINTFGLGAHGRTRSNVWTYPGTNSFHAGRMDELSMHPTVKPVSLVADAMRDCSMKGDIVLDFFLGSGTTIVAAEKVGRRGFGLEIDPAYVDVAVRRWQAFTHADAVLASDGRTFDEVAAARTAPPTDTAAHPRPRKHLRKTRVPRERIKD